MGGERQVIFSETWRGQGGAAPAGKVNGACLATAIHKVLPSGSPIKKRHLPLAAVEVGRGAIPALPAPLQVLAWSHDRRKAALGGGSTMAPRAHARILGGGVGGGSELIGHVITLASRPDRLPD
eukprot:scaffold7997_cov126-Isochrysis_galbana.AAC.2